MDELTPDKGRDGDASSQQHDTDPTTATPVGVRSPDDPAGAGPSVPGAGPSVPGAGPSVPGAGPTTAADDPDGTEPPWTRLVSWVVVGLASVGVLASLGIPQLLTDSVPTGGDMGAHVWGPQYLIDHLLPNLRLSGWTPDWYAGFPAYVFYMVVPSLFIVWLSVGPPLWLTPVVLVLVAWATRECLRRVSTGWVRVLIWSATVFFAVLALPIPYNVAFKWVTVSGLVTLPLAAFALGRAARVPFPGPPIIALGTIPFIYDKGFTILGGNGASTMAGEFAFSISLTFAFLYLAVLLRGVRTGRDRALGAILLALTILCHLIPAIFIGIATFVLLWVRREDRTPWWDENRVGRVVAAALVVVTLVIALPTESVPLIGGVIDAVGPQWLFPAVASLVALAFFSSWQPQVASYWREPEGRRVGLGIALVGLGAVLIGLAVGVVHLSPWWLVVLGVLVVLVLCGGWDLRLVRWILPVGVTGVLLSAFWSVPFLMSSTHMNDMGWEKYTRYTEHLLASPISDMSLPGMPYRNVVYALAGLGVVLSMVHRVRFGYFLSLWVLAFAWIFRYFPQYRLWNARLLPFLYMGIYLLAALAASLVIRSVALAVAEWWKRRDAGAVVSTVGLAAVSVVVLVITLGSFGWLPGARAEVTSDNRSVNRWLGMNFETSLVPGWARWNYSGLEGKDAWPEFSGVVEMMERVGEDNGCGRTMWEYNKDYMEPFGTPMALMLLPYFTDGCIASMEGLYFEASTTTPFHFLNQAELSTQGSNAQRDLPYSGFDISKGVSHLQMMGVKYYLASSPQAIAAARGEPRLTEVAQETFVGPGDGTGGVDEHEWVVFEVQDTELVTGLEYAPVVLTDANDHIDGWVYAAEQEVAPEGEPRVPKSPGPAVRWYNDPGRWDVHLATSGPDDWPRASSNDPDPPRRAEPPVEVSDVRMTNDSVSFRVDEVGVPVLVKVSYFPAWTVDGAEGPYRVTPNFMVVVPTENEVTLTYGDRPADLLGWGGTLAGLVLLGYLAVLDDRRQAARRVAGSGAADSGAADTGEAGSGAADRGAAARAGGDRDGAGVPPVEPGGAPPGGSPE